MKKNFSSNIKISVNLLKENFDEQYEECISTLGSNEIQMNIGSKFTNISQHQVFQKREKLVHSPESKEHPQSQNFEREESQEQEPENFKSKINNLLQQTEHIVFKYDQVFTSYNGESDSIENISKDHYEKISKYGKNLVMFSFFKSNSISNYSVEEHQFKRDIEKSNFKSIGLFPSVILRYFGDKTNRLEDESQGIKIKIFSIYSQKFYDLSGLDVKSHETVKEVTKQKILKQEELWYFINNARNNILFKKQYQFTHICYEIEMKHAQDKKSKISYIEFFNPFERSFEKTEKEKPTKNLESSIDIFINSLRILYTIFTNSKFDQSFNDKDKILEILKSNWKYNTEFHFHANLRPLYPFYSQDLMILQYLNKIYERKEAFDTLFINMLFQILSNSDTKKSAEQHFKKNENKVNQLNIDNSSTIEELMKKNQSRTEENNKLLKENQLLSKSLVELKNQKTKIESEFEFLKNNTAAYIEKIKNQYENEIAGLNQKLMSLTKISEKKTGPILTFTSIPVFVYTPSISLQDKVEKIQAEIMHTEKTELSQNSSKIITKLIKLLSTQFFNLVEHDIEENMNKLEVVNNLNNQKIDLLHKRCKLLENQNQFLRNALNLLIDKQRSSKSLTN